MQGTTWIQLCGVHSLGFAVFHLAFWRIFKWPATLASTTYANRIIIQILNLRISYVFTAMALACFIFPDELLSTALGNAVLATGCVFWIGRTVEQLAFLPRSSKVGNTLIASFITGAILFGIPLLS
jgi:hypothetical protein